MVKSPQVVLMYLITHLGLIFFTFPANIISSSAQGHWAAILLGIVVHLLVLAMYMKGLTYFGQKDIVDIYLGVGKGIAFVVLVPLAIYFLMTIVIILRAYSEIVDIVFLSNTPLWAIVALILLISTYIASHGLESIYRTGIMIGILFLPLLLILFVSSFQNVDWRYLFPLLDVDFSFLTDQSYLQSSFAFTGGYLFLGFVQPYFTYRLKPVMIAALALIPVFVFAVYIPIMTFGQATASTFLFPFVVAVDTLNLDWLMFDRVTVFFLLSLITFIMLLISTILWTITRMLGAVVPRAKFQYLLYPLAALVFVLCLAIPDWDALQKLFSWNIYIRFYTLLTVPFSIYFLGYRSKRKMAIGN